MTMPPDAVPIDRYAVLGHPVRHSRSPAIHALFAEQTGQRMVYGRLDCPADGFADALRSFAASTEGVLDDGRAVNGPVRGCNVTVPFKFEVPALAARLTERARLAQAANTVRFDAEGWLADNTDGAGLCADIQRHAGVALAGRRVLLLGAGGAAAGVLGPLIEAGPVELVVANRTPTRADTLVRRHAGWAAAHGVALHAAALDQPGRAFDVVVNGTASSLHGDAAPAPATVLRPGTLVVDMMYGPAAAPFLSWAALHGAAVRDGLGMLVEQAAESFFLWRGVRPDTAPVLSALRALAAAPAVDGG